MLYIIYKNYVFKGFFEDLNKCIICYLDIISSIFFIMSSIFVIVVFINN